MYRKHKKNMETTTAMKSNATGLKTFDKIAEIPVVDSALNKVTDMYGQMKDRNTLLRTGCNLAEMSLRTLKFASTPITTLMQKPIEQVDTYLSDKVEVLENAYPSITQPTEQIRTAAYTQAKGIYDKTADIYYRPKQTLYTLGDFTVSTATTCGARVLETCLENRYAKVVTEPALEYAEKTLDYYLPASAAMVEGQGAVTRLYNINKRVYSHVYDATFVQLTKLHMQFERMIEKMMSLRALMEEMYAARKTQVVTAISENTLVQRCQTYLRENNWSLESLEKLSRSYYKAILADVTDILEKYMGLIKTFPAYFSGSQIREKIDFMKNQMNTESFKIYFGMTIDYLKQINDQLVAYTNKMMELAGESKNNLTNMCLATLSSGSKPTITSNTTN